jgi:uncharacterized protein (TIGR02001 family)
LAEAFLRIHIILLLKPVQKEIAMKNSTFNPTHGKTLRAAAVALLAMTACTAGVVQAEDKKPDNEVAVTAAVTTDYRFRGISQTRLGAALQGSVDYTNNPSGFYAGVWASDIKWIKDAGGDGSIEWDLYAGKRGEIGSGVSYDFGGIGYVYPSNDLNPNANTFEVYGQLGYGPVYIKYSHALSNVFGFVDSKNSGYLDLGANIEIQDGYILNLHLGHQSVRSNTGSSYTDYKIGVTKDYGVVSVSLAAYRADSDAYVGQGKNLGKTGLVLALSKTF